MPTLTLQISLFSSRFILSARHGGFFEISRLYDSAFNGTIPKIHHALQNTSMNTSSSTILRSTILRFTDRMLELTLRMVLYVSPRTFTASTNSSNTPFSIRRFQRLLEFMKSNILRTSNTKHNPSNGSIPFLTFSTFDFTLCMNDTIEFPFSNDLIGIGRQRCFHACKHPRIAFAFASR